MLRSRTAYSSPLASETLTADFFCSVKYSSLREEKKTINLFPCLHCSANKSKMYNKTNLLWSMMLIEQLAGNVPHNEFSCENDINFYEYLHIYVATIL